MLPADARYTEGRQQQKKLAGKLTYTLNRKKIVSLIDTNHAEMNALTKEDTAFDIYICSPDSAKNYFIYKYKDHNKFMIEDGLKTYVTSAPDRIKKITSKLVNRPLVNGFDNRITKVFATTPEDLPKELRQKSEQLNWKSTLAKMSQEKLDELTKAFLPSDDLKSSQLFPLNKTKSIIITQTLNEDGIVPKESVKLKYYQEFVDQAQTDLIYFKPHPRERTDYAKVFESDKRIIILPKLFPAELLNLLPNLSFQKAFTAYSTAIDNLTNVEEKIVLGHERFKK